MNRILLLSWIYGSEKDCQNGAIAFFNSLKNGLGQGKLFPFETPSEISLIRNQRAIEWLVAIRVMQDTSKDDSIEQNAKLETWFKQCNAVGYDDKVGKPLIGRSVETTLGEGWDYIEHFTATRPNRPPSAPPSLIPQVPITAPASLTCQSCQKNLGTPYSFYYGNQTDKTEKQIGKTKTTTTTYHIAGLMQVALCQQCINKKGFRDASGTLMVMAVVALIAWVVFFLFLPQNNWLSYVFPGIFSVACLVAANQFLRFRSDEVYRLEKTNGEETGEKLAIEISTESLVEKGYHVFFTPKEKNSLQ